MPTKRKNYSLNTYFNILLPKSNQSWSVYFLGLIRIPWVWNLPAQSTPPYFLEIQPSTAWESKPSLALYLRSPSVSCYFSTRPQTRGTEGSFYPLLSLEVHLWTLCCSFSLGHWLPKFAPDVQELSFSLYINRNSSHRRSCFLQEVKSVHHEAVL